eukprot:CAMPEP_0119009784 /NCGR_PEP_ID=MMETSP1176-20130426/4600_1 /TAXON_ID=265551 /ORGANISM="Synedropsis recta cf, Strain CCMP1620" /LENGTH=57 /DNA_ID=CAMNT_0006962359 /DNA_START=53 /DNA_END=226 /DNA_ORIENTATION=+
MTGRSDAHLIPTCAVWRKRTGYYGGGVYLGFAESTLRIDSEDNPDNDNRFEMHAASI